MSFPPIGDCWFLTGATACGKSALALPLAERLGAEILSLDSMAVYRGMDIGTAKPTADEQRRVPHHLIDLVEPGEEFSIAEYVAAAHRAVGDVIGRGRVALFVGGTPLYLKALLRGLFVGPAADWEFRRRMEAETAKFGDNHLHARLATVDAATAARLHPRDRRRIIRALEVFEQTGEPISSLQGQFDRARPAAECKCFVIERPRDELTARIDDRVDAMFAAGLVDETLRLLAAGHTLSRTAAQAVGYREVIEHLHGERDLAATVELVKLRTRQFSKRQMTWFRSLSECHTISVSSADDAPQLVERLVAAGESRQ
ncbi:MAG: tRNA (adenosine(37)-N6)-dimethylallyltransferase MiaA [Pirellulales bacterium]